MQNATTLRYFGATPPLDATTQALIETGCITAPPLQGDTAGLGSILGGALGSVAGTFVGPAGTAIGGTLGSALGGAVEGAVTRRPRPAKRPPQRRSVPPPPPLPLAPAPAPSAPPGQIGVNERRILAEALKTGNAALVQDAVLRVTDPQRYEADRVLGRLPSQRAKPKLNAPLKLSRFPLKRETPGPQAPAPQPSAQPSQPTSAELMQAFQGLLAAAQNPSPTMPAAAPASASTWAPPPTPTQDPVELSGDEQLEGDYYDTGAPQDRRPRPRRHLSLIPLKQHQLEAIARAVPALEKLDLRLIKLMAGTAGARTRDTSGIDAATRTYHAEPGETAAGITKKLTGDEARVPDLLAANPGHQEGDTVWRIPPGWIAFDYADTGAPNLATARKYIVQDGDSPIGIATKLGAKASHPRWWSELKKANPQKETSSDGGNWKTLWAGEEIGIPDDWPSHPMAIPTGNAPAGGSLPGLPNLPWPGIPNAPPASGLPPFSIPTIPASNSTMDAGVMLQAQGMLALWRYQNAAACNPPDFGMSPTEFTGTATPRTVQAVQSFQMWWNQKNAPTPLRIDGTLDDATYKALYSSTAAIVPGPMPQPPQTPPKPSGTTIPVPMSSSSPPAPAAAPAILALPAPTADPPQSGQVPGLPQGWTWTTPTGPYGLPWQAPAPPASQSAPQAPGLPPGWTTTASTGPYGMPWQAPTPPPEKSDSSILPLGLGLLAAMLF